MVPRRQQHHESGRNDLSSLAGIQLRHSGTLPIFRNESYRKHIRRTHSDDPSVQSMFKTFKGTLAKWRFETLWTVLSSLTNLRPFCEHRFSTVSFDKVKDKEHIGKVIIACNKKDLWIFIENVLKLVIQFLE